jgi:hypothetical protein
VRVQPNAVDSISSCLLHCLGSVRFLAALENCEPLLDRLIHEL